MLRAEGGNPQQTRVHLENLYQMVQYCENEVDCQRVQLLEYFAEKFDARHCRDECQLRLTSLNSIACIVPSRAPTLMHLGAFIYMERQSGQKSIYYKGMI